MKILARAVLLPAIIFCATFCAAQTPAKEATASISGHVTTSGKPGAGIVVVAMMSTSFFDNKTIAKTTTDEEGNYKLTGLTAGRFAVMPLAKAFVTSGAYKQPGQPVNLGDGEAVAKIDFDLVRGGVVTGRITDAEGHPIIGERVSVALKDSPPDTGVQMTMFGGSRNQTDDRGVYRVYGLGPGSYKVSVGQAAAGGGAVSIMGIGGSQYVKTFYPGVQDELKATPIEIKEGTEATNIDITVGKPGSGFSVSGRVIDADSNQPVANIYIAHGSVSEADQIGGMNFTGNQTDANGKFRLEGLRPGKYAVFAVSMGEENSTYGDPARFEISGSDVTGIEIKLRPGGTISGIAVMENSSDPAVAGLLQTITLAASVEAKGLGVPSYSRGQIGADGSFRFTGLPPGKARIFVQGFPPPPKSLTLVRIEIEGLEQQEGIEVTAGGNIAGVRVVFAHGTGSIRGDVKIEGGALPKGTTLRISVQSVTSSGRRFNRSLEIDARNHFVLENIPPGDYELTLSAVASDPGIPTPIKPVKRTVTVANGAATPVTIVFDVNAEEGGQQ